MGSEQSSQRNGRNKVGKSNLGGRLRKEKKNSRESPEENECSRNGSTSPGPSVCSDSDLPYISYTVNRPIGVDSPKISSKSALHRGKSLGSEGNSPARRKFNTRKISELTSKVTSGHDIVVVKAAKEPESQDKDAYLLKLQTIPMFLPIMRGTLNLPGMRDPEILERLDPQDLLGLCKRLQNHMAFSAEHVAKNQNEITNRIREVDFELCHLVTSLGERQKRLAKHAEKISKVTEISQMLNSCHSQLNGVLGLMEKLNNNLPMDLRLEPFVWTTG